MINSVRNSLRMPIVRRPKAVAPSKYSITSLLSTLFFIIVSIIILCYLFAGKRTNEEVVETVPLSFEWKDLEPLEDKPSLVNVIGKNKGSYASKGRKSKRMKAKNKIMRNRELNVIRGSSTHTLSHSLTHSIV